MKVTFKKKVGNSEFEFEINAESQKDFIQQVSFLAQLPEVGPNGETDLALTHRMTKDGSSYYSVVCQSAGQELALGQYKQAKGKDEFFVKGWQPLWKPEGADEGLGNATGSVEYGLGLGASEVEEEVVPTPAVKKAAAPAVKAAPKAAAPVAKVAPKVAAPAVKVAPKVAAKVAPAPQEMEDLSGDDSDV